MNSLILPADGAKPFETNAELHHGRFRRIGHGEARVDRFGPLHEERDGVVDRQRRQRVLVLAFEP